MVRIVSLSLSKAFIFFILVLSCSDIYCKGSKDKGSKGKESVEDVILEFTIEDSTSVEFEDVSLTNSDFTFDAEKMYYIYEGAIPWNYQSNESRGKYKLDGKVTQPFLSGWELSFILDPPEDSNGTFGRSAKGGRYIPLTTTNQTYVTNISKGRVGNMQSQHAKLTISEKAWDLASGTQTPIVIMWTLFAD